MTWSGYAFDPRHSLLVTNTNNIVALARLIPRAKYDQRGSHAEDGDHGDQTGAPYGFVPALPAISFGFAVQRAAWGLLTAIDMTEGKFAGKCRSVQCRIFGGVHKQQIPAGSISLGGPIVTAAGWCSSPARPTPASAASISKLARNFGKRNFRLAQTPCR